MWLLYTYEDPDFYALQLILDPSMPQPRSPAVVPDEGSEAEAADDEMAEEHTGLIIHMLVRIDVYACICIYASKGTYDACMYIAIYMQGIGV